MKFVLYSIRLARHWRLNENVHLQGVTVTQPIDTERQSNVSRGRHDFETDRKRFARVAYEFTFYF